MRSPEDSQLQHFLRHHRPVPPPASRQVEAEIMGQVLTQLPTGKGSRVWLWGLVGVLMLGSGGLVTTQLFRPQALTAHELSELDFYVADRWDSLFTPVEEPLPTLMFSSSLD